MYSNVWGNQSNRPLDASAFVDSTVQELTDGPIPSYSIFALKNVSIKAQNIQPTKTKSTFLKKLKM